jgi:hypothetical protein
MSLIESELWESEPGDLANATDKYLEEYIKECFGWETEFSETSPKVWIKCGPGKGGTYGATFREALEKALISAKARGIL